MNKKLLVLAIATMLIASCSNNTHVISGKLTNSQPDSYLRLDQVKANELVTVDSVKLDEAGSFSFKRESEDPMFYVLRTHDESFLTVIIEPGEKLEIVADYDSLNTPTSAKGAVGTEIMLQYNKELNFTRRKNVGTKRYLYAEHRESGT